MRIRKWNKFHKQFIRPVNSYKTWNDWRFRNNKQQTISNNTINNNFYDFRYNTIIFKMNRMRNNIPSITKFFVSNSRITVQREANFLMPVDSRRHFWYQFHFALIYSQINKQYQDIYRLTGNKIEFFFLTVDHYFSTDIL